MENQKELTVEEKPTLFSGLKTIGLGVVLFVLAYYFYITMSNYESGESIRMNRLLLLVYKLLGKSITAGLLSLIGLFFTYLGVREMLDSRK